MRHLGAPERAGLKVRKDPTSKQAPGGWRTSGRPRTNPVRLTSWFAHETGLASGANEVAHCIEPSIGEQKCPCRLGLAEKYAAPKKTQRYDARDTRTAP